MSTTKTQKKVGFSGNVTKHEAVEYKSELDDPRSKGGNKRTASSPDRGGKETKTSRTILPARGTKR
ncbi:hypothetical protein BCON_0199g00150 [Botryotinia convoluta]|uniref:Uncharacterized protein n=1 Tax=Botryotinia convoluta TaxID=54673 RepID=A0A4Z1HYG0_9HELO|nr:hypothetical protein BCON_0199g00150 [Botryotinia convoluta]